MPRSEEGETARPVYHVGRLHPGVSNRHS